MSQEKFENSEPSAENNAGERMESASAVAERLIGSGWSKEQVGGFATAIKMMADEMERAGVDGHAGIVSIELSVTNDPETGEEEAEVTLTGEGEELDPDQLSDLVSNREFFEAVMNEATPEFFVNMNKVVLTRKKDRDSDGFRSIKNRPA